MCPSLPFPESVLHVKSGFSFPKTQSLTLNLTSLAPQWTHFSLVHIRQGPLWHDPNPSCRHLLLMHSLPSLGTRDIFLDPCAFARAVTSSLSFLLPCLCL